MAMCDNSNVPNTGTVTKSDLHDLLVHFSKTTYLASSADHPIVKLALDKVITFMKMDYNVLLIGNTTGELSAHYPSQILVLESELTHTSPDNTIYEHKFDAIKLKELIYKARNARCHARFPVPVILYKGKYICRSATLSGGVEMYGRRGFDYFFSSNEPTSSEEDEETVQLRSQSEWQLFDVVRSQDIKLLKTFNVGTIVDFMVEKKKVKFGVNVTSSEKVDKENRYSDFNIVSLPYPGCEFFKDFRDNAYSAEGLMFDWSPSHVDASICVPVDPIVTQLQIDWNNYKEWDLVKITQKYMRLLLKYIQDNSSGLLLHCISGWDRTPLFVSLIRLSLWADGIIHRDLDLQQILYLTVAYDWMFFGHHLNDRLGKGEDIFMFCFYMLKHITDDEYSISGRIKGKLDRGNDRGSDRSNRNEHTFERLNTRQTDRLFSRNLDRSIDQPDYSFERNLNHRSSSITRSIESETVDEASRLENEMAFEAMFSDPEGSGSNISCPSAGSSVSNKFQDQAIVPDEPNNGNPVSSDTPSTAKTSQSASSPVMVPRPSSDNSVASGSWQLVTNAPSLRNLNTVSVTTNVDAGSSHDTTINPGGEIEATTDVSVMGRKDRLIRLRALFYSHYYTGIGITFKNIEDSTLKNLLGNFAEKVGFTPKV